MIVDAETSFWMDVWKTQNEEAKKASEEFVRKDKFTINEQFAEVEQKFEEDNRDGFKASSVPEFYEGWFKVWEDPWTNFGFGSLEKSISELKGGLFKVGGQELRNEVEEDFFEIYRLLENGHQVDEMIKWEKRIKKMEGEMAAEIQRWQRSNEAHSRIWRQELREMRVRDSNRQRSVDSRRIAALRTQESYEKEMKYEVLIHKARNSIHSSQWRTYTRKMEEEDNALNEEVNTNRVAELENPKMFKDVDVEYLEGQFGDGFEKASKTAERMAQVHEYPSADADSGQYSPPRVELDRWIPKFTGAAIGGAVPEGEESSGDGGGGFERGIGVETSTTKSSMNPDFGSQLTSKMKERLNYDVKWRNDQLQRDERSQLVPIEELGEISKKRAVTIEDGDPQREKDGVLKQVREGDWYWPEVDEKGKFHTDWRCVAAQWMYESGPDFLKNMWDVCIVCSEGENPEKDPASKSWTDFFRAFYNNPLVWEQKGTVPFQVAPAVRPAFVGDAVMFAVRCSNIGVPRPKSEVFEDSFLFTKIKRMRSKVAFTKRAEMNVLLDEPMNFLSIFNLASNNNRVTPSLQLRPVLNAPFSTNPIFFQSDLHNKKIYMNVLVKHRLLMDDRQVKVREMGHGDRVNALGAMTQLPYWCFEDVNFIGSTTDIEFKRDTSGPMDITVPFLFKRLYKVDTQSRAGHDFTPMHVVTNQDDQKAMDNRGEARYYYGETS